MNFEFYSSSISSSFFLSLSLCILNLSQKKARHNKITCWGDSESVVAFEVSVLSAKAYCERILCTHLNGDNGHHFLSIHSRIGLSHRNESFVYKFVSWMILGRFTNFGNPLSLTPPRLPMCILSYLLQIRYEYIFFFLSLKPTYTSTRTNAS